MCKPKKRVNVIAPICNEASTLPEFLARIFKIADQLAPEFVFEAILVDDGSCDSSLQVAKDLLSTYPGLKILELRRNYGQSAALQAGIDFANGDIIITLDADLQHFPEEIPKFLEKIKEGYDVVCGWRQDRKEGALRRWPSSAANWLVRGITGLKIRDVGTTYRAYKKELIQDIHLLGENHRFVPVFADIAGARITEIPIENVERIHGVSNYGLSRTVNVFLDLFFLFFIVRYLDRPIRIFGKFALTTFGVGLFITIALTTEWLVNGTSVVREHSGWFTVGIFSYLASAQFMLTGILAEILSRIYYSTREQSAYKIRNIWPENSSS